MKRSLPLLLVTGAMVVSPMVSAQRYLTEVFPNASLVVTPNITYGTNIDFLTSNFGSPLVPNDITTLQTAVLTGNPIPAPYFDTGDPSTGLKVINLGMDVYEPDQNVDTEPNRPLVVYLHTGNALPPPVNGSPNGLRTDSCAVEMCMRMARRGYVAVSMSYRLGWNPLLPSEQERRGSLLNAIYRAIHDVRECVRYMKADAADANSFNIDPSKIIVIGEGTGGYIALANATLDDPDELFIEKFLPDPFDPTTSYVDTTMVGNIYGFNAPLTLYQPNGFDHSTQFCVNMGGALADTSWLAPGDVPMVAFHTTFDPFAPFTEGIVIVPTTGGPVVPVQGSNLFIQLANDFGNNNSFDDYVSNDPYTVRARSLYGTTVTHGTDDVLINTGTEGLFPMITPDWTLVNPAFNEEASPWQWWDPNSPLAQAVVIPGPPPITAGQASQSSNPNFSGAKGRAYIDTVMGYMNPRIVCALELGPCDLFSGVNDANTTSTVDVYPNPASDRFTVSGGREVIQRVEIFTLNGRLVRTYSVNARQASITRDGLGAGAYVVQLHLPSGTVMRKLMLD